MSLIQRVFRIVVVHVSSVGEIRRRLRLVALQVIYYISVRLLILLLLVAQVEFELVVQPVVGCHLITATSATAYAACK